MKTISILTTLTLSLLAQDSYSDKKIDMHGGNYNKIGDYSSGSFRNTRMDMSMFLDENSSKNITKQKIQTKK